MSESINVRLDSIMDSVLTSQTYGDKAMDYAASYGYARVMLLDALLDMTQEKSVEFLAKWERIYKIKSGMK
jgi:hypothetical protein